MSLSKIVVSGRVVRAPEKRFTPNNNLAVTEFTIAVESPQRQDGQVESSPIKVVTWGELAERVASDIKKGDLVAVDGRLQVASYTASDGQRKRDAEINAIAVDNLGESGASKSTGEDREVEAPGPRSAPKGKKPAAEPKGDDLDAIFSSEDEIPF